MIDHEDLIRFRQSLKHFPDILIDKLLKLSDVDFKKYVHSSPAITKADILSLYALRNPMQRYMTDAAKSVVYLVKSQIGLYKIGYTSNLDQRLSKLRLRINMPIELIHSIQTDKPKALETELHQHFKHRNFCAEWFVLTLEDIKYIKSL